MGNCNYLYEDNTALVMFKTSVKVGVDKGCKQV